MKLYYIEFYLSHMSPIVNLTFSGLVESTNFMDAQESLNEVAIEMTGIKCKIIATKIDHVPVKINIPLPFIVITGV